jgi:hypothetical protein
MPTPHPGRNISPEALRIRDTLFRNITTPHIIDLECYWCIRGDVIHTNTSVLDLLYFKSQEVWPILIKRSAVVGQLYSSYLVKCPITQHPQFVCLANDMFVDEGALLWDMAKVSLGYELKPNP